MHRDSLRKYRRWLPLPIGFILWLMTRSLMGLAPTAAAGPQPNGSVVGCSAAPNCVSTTETRPDHALEPMALEALSEPFSWSAIVAAVEAEGGRVIASKTDYLHAVFTTPWMRFHDDVEIAWDASTRRLHLRSASRLGYSDLGANRKRAQRLRARIAEALDRTE